MANHKELKELQLETVDWAEELVGDSTLNAFAAGAIEQAIGNMIDQARVVADHDGVFSLLLTPANASLEKSELISAKNDSENVILAFNILDALEAEIEWWIEDHSPAERAEIQKDLLELGEKITKLAERLT